MNLVELKDGMNLRLVKKLAHPSHRRINDLNLKAVAYKADNIVSNPTRINGS